MLDSGPDSTDDSPTDDSPAGRVDDGEYRQHASADVAPELFDDAPGRR